MAYLGQKKWWGERYANCPASLLKELNGGKRPEQIVRSENVLADADLKKV